MGSNIARQQLVDGINRAFSAANIEATSRRLLPLSADADFLEICHRLDLLGPVMRTTLAAYREELTMPPLARHLMTAAFRYSVLSEPPTPLHLTIKDGKLEVVEVTMEPALISVVLVREAPPTRAR